jgi:hypothetical protein
MPARSASYRQSLLFRLQDRSEAEAYLDAARADSLEALATAIQNVRDSGRMAAELALAVECPRCASVPRYRCASQNPAAYRFADEDYFLEQPHAERVQAALAPYLAPQERI